MRIQIPESLPKVFVLSTPIHLLAKLHWEIKGFQRSLSSKSIFATLLPAYHAFNCAVTAWHVTDWTWEYVAAEGRSALAATYGLEGVNFGLFQDAVAQSSRALNACREIATGSKHRDVKRSRADPHVRAGAEWAALKPDRSGTPRYGTVWLIVDRHGKRPALEVFREAAEFWREVLSPWMEDRFVEGRRFPRARRRP